ncbi:hypothetical protein [Undibacterium sp.]|uniref:hypothetical protein n=1 Tax=Undibacterium sp. TaxID=1914977 RepID=UPI0025E579D6|nr:hypothetical protein [Undibacterium sp.]
MKRTFLCIIFLFSSLANAAPDAYSIAYEDSFVRYVAGRLTTETAKDLGIDKMPIDVYHQLVGDLQVIYWRELISCDGPLPAVAKILLMIDMQGRTEPATYHSALSLIGNRDYEFWPLIESWEKKIHSRVKETLWLMTASQQYPKCLVAGYKPPKFENP